MPIQDLTSQNSELSHLLAVVQDWVLSAALWVSEICTAMVDSKKEITWWFKGTWVYTGRFALWELVYYNAIGRNSAPAAVT